MFGGIAAVLLSFLVPGMLSPEQTWSDSSAAEKVKTELRIQKIIDEIAETKDGGQLKKLKDEFEQLQARHAELEAGLEGAFNRPFWMSIVCLVIGIGMVGAGLGTYYFAPMPKEKPKTLAELDPDGTLANKEVTALDYTTAVRTSRKTKSKH